MKTSQIAHCSIICALSLVILLVGIIPGFFYISIISAIAIVVFAKQLYGTKQWIMCYIVSSLLALLLIPDLDLSLTYTCIGWYPFVRFKLRNKRVYYQIIIKSLVFILASHIIYNISIFVFGSDQIMKNIPFFEVLYIIAFCIIFTATDIGLKIFEKYVYNIYKRLLKMK